jgi:hypothetical protein
MTPRCDPHSPVHPPPLPCTRSMARGCTGVACSRGLAAPLGPLRGWAPPGRQPSATLRGSSQRAGVCSPRLEQCLPWLGTHSRGRPPPPPPTPPSLLQTPGHPPCHVKQGGVLQGRQHCRQHQELQPRRGCAPPGVNFTPGMLPPRPAGGWACPEHLCTQEIHTPRQHCLAAAAAAAAAEPEAARLLTKRAARRDATTNDTSLCRRMPVALAIAFPWCLCAPCSHFQRSGPLDRPLPTQAGHAPGRGRGRARM